MMQSKVTRFRAYQLGSPGSSFSYYAAGHFTMLEGRLTDQSRSSVLFELKQCGVSGADTLHITSWDADHCAAGELPELLEILQPSHIEAPGYSPHCDNARKCAVIIEAYRKLPRNANRPVKIEYVTPAFIAALPEVSAVAFQNIFYHPRQIDREKNNNNSTVKLFRKGSFNVLSMGDVESVNLSAYLRRLPCLRREVDAMILAHHGADNGFTNKKLLERLTPAIAVCSSDYDNKHDHPDDAIRDLLHELDIALMTTKTGDVLVKSIDNHTGLFKAINLVAGSTKVSSELVFRSKKSKLLVHNDDTVRETFATRRSIRWI